VIKNRLKIPKALAALAGQALVIYRCSIYRQFLFISSILGVFYLLLPALGLLENHGLISKAEASI
jgi:uncharacterized membrane protein